MTLLHLFDSEFEWVDKLPLFFSPNISLELPLRDPLNTGGFTFSYE